MSCEATILVLLSKAQFADGKYVVSIDVVQAKKADALIKSRAKKDGFVIEKCLMDTGKSPTLCLQLKDGRCAIEFEVTGALKPLTEFCQGETVLQFVKGKDSKEQGRKIVVLERNMHDRSTTASIKFTVHGAFLHRVTIGDVPLPAEQEMMVEAKVGGKLEQEIMVEAKVGGKLEQEMMVEAEVGGKLAAASLTVAAGSEFEEVSEHVMTDFSDGSIGAGNKATPLAPRFQSVMPQPPPDEISVMRQQRESVAPEPREPRDPLQTAMPYRPDLSGVRGGGGRCSGYSEEYDDANDEDTDSIITGVSRVEPPPVHPSPSTITLRDDTPRGRILQSQSLSILAKALTPQNANRLFAGLNVRDSTIQQASTNHPRDIVETHHQILREWRNSNATQGSDATYDTLLNELTVIGRNDIRVAIEAVEREGRQLTSQDIQ